MTCLETATMTFAIMNIVLVSLSSATSFGYLFFWMVQVFNEYSEGKFDGQRAGLHYINLFFIFCWVAVSLLAVVFGSFLLNGSIKRKPQHMKAYFIYGVVKICFAVFVLTVAANASHSDNDWPSMLGFLAGFAIYAGILNMIRLTYTKMEIEQQQFNHKLLNEKC